MKSHHIALVTQTGVLFTHTIEVAEETPALNATSFALLATVGALLGIVPVAIGLLAWPGMRSISQSGLNFLLALTIGLLAFLLIDTIGEGLEEAAETIGRLRGPVLFWVIFALTTLILLALGRRQGRARGPGTCRLHRFGHRFA